MPDFIYTRPAQMAAAAVIVALAVAGYVPLFRHLVQPSAAARARPVELAPLPPPAKALVPARPTESIDYQIVEVTAKFDDELGPKLFFGNTGFPCQPSIGPREAQSEAKSPPFLFQKNWEFCVARTALPVITPLQAWAEVSSRDGAPEPDGMTIYVPAPRSVFPNSQMYFYVSVAGMCEGSTRCVAGASAGASQYPTRSSVVLPDAANEAAYFQSAEALLDIEPVTGEVPLNVNAVGGSDD